MEIVNGGGALNLGGVTLTLALPLRGRGFLGLGFGGGGGYAARVTQSPPCVNTG